MRITELFSPGLKFDILSVIIKEWASPTTQKGSESIKMR
jgi:hypothetical protein